MKKIGLIALFLSSASLAACGGDKFDEALSKFGAFQKKVCACKDMACADKVKEEMEKWMEGMMKSIGDKKPSKAQDEKFDKIDDAMDACVDKLRGDKPADAPPTP